MAKNEKETQSDKKDRGELEQNSEQTLQTLEQLSQTLEVMSCVVDRLKQHLTRQLSLNAELFQDEERLRLAQEEEGAKAAKQLQQESFVIEITQQELGENVKGKKTIH
jgi:hypothetical protein